MHAWDQPAETLLALAPSAGVQLMMPRLGEPTEPLHHRVVEPWWRAVDGGAQTELPERGAATAVPKSRPWPID